MSFSIKPGFALSPVLIFNSILKNSMIAFEIIFFYMLGCRTIC